MDNIQQPIDFVITWMDPDDENWRREKAKYWAEVIGDPTYDSNAVARFRDWGTFQYLFRGIEKFAPWVNHIYLVTWDTVPEWLNTEHPKITCIKDRELIPQECVPAFSPNPVEINFHKIPGIAEHFVYFNDDMFLLSAVTGEDFYHNGLPREMAIPYHLTNSEGNNLFIHMVVSMMGVINSRFDFKQVKKEHFFKWFNLQYGRNLRTSLSMLGHRKLSGLVIPHLPSPMRKSVYKEVWAQVGERLDATQRHRFRDAMDMTQYLFRYWSIMKGEFTPTNVFRYGKEFFMNDEGLNTLCGIIEAQSYKMLCINDSKDIQDFEKCRDAVIQSFEKILPEKSAFEL